MEIWKRLLLLVFLFGVIPTAIYGIYVQVQTGRRIHPEIARTLIEPYSRALAAGNYPEAYESFTSSPFRKEHARDAFLQAQHENRVKYGDLREILPRPGEAFQSAGNLFSGRSYYQGGLTYRYSKADVLVVWEVAKENGAFRIDAMFQEFHERLTPAIF